MEKVIQPLTSAEELKAQVEREHPPQRVTAPVEVSPPASPQTTGQTVPPVSIYPTPTSPDVPGTVPRQFLTGSSMLEVKRSIPKGIYLIVGSQFVGIGLSLFSSADNNAIFTLVQVADLLLGVGLLFRFEFVRKTMIFLAAVVAVLAVVAIFGLLAVQEKVNQAAANYSRAMSQINQSAITEQQRSELATLSAEVQAERQKEGRAMVIAGVNLGMEIIVAAGTIIYLNRPKVRAVFRNLEA